MEINSVGVIGLGYIGLPTAILLAKADLKVVGFDINPDVVKKVIKGQAHFFEPGLDDLLAEVVRKNLLNASCVITPSDAFIIAVPTPLRSDNSPDLDAVMSAAESLAPVLRGGELIILESTSPVGTTKAIQELIYASRPDLAGHLFFAYCPERAIPGKTLEELVLNDRNIGGVDDQSTARAIALYKKFVVGSLISTTSDVAEMVKLVENTSRDVALAFANELSVVCANMKINVNEVIALANRHPRVNILNPGVGVGGHCIPIDPYFIIHSNQKLTNLMQAARVANLHKVQWVVDQILEFMSIRFSGDTLPVVAFLGVSYKADTGDIRESPALKIIELIASSGKCKVISVDPFVDKVTGFEHYANIESIPTPVNLYVGLVKHSLFYKYFESSVIQEIPLLSFV